MCVRVHRSNHLARPWDPSSGTITIPAHLGPDLAIFAVRVVLAELAVVQPTSGAVCWCGAPVNMAPISDQ